MWVRAALIKRWHQHFSPLGIGDGPIEGGFGAAAPTSEVSGVTNMRISPARTRLPSPSALNNPQPIMHNPSHAPYLDTSKFVFNPLWEW